MAHLASNLSNTSRGRAGVIRSTMTSLSSRNYSFRFEAAQDGECVTFRSYDGVPAVIAYSNGRYAHEPTWYRNFLYSEEQARGLDSVEDLASPGVFEFSLSQKPAVLMLATETVAGGGDPGSAAN